MKAFDTRSKGRSNLFAEEINAWNDVSRDFRDRSLNQNTPVRRPNTEKQIVFLKNDGAIDIPQYGVVMIKDLIFQPSDNEDEFLFRFGFKGECYEEGNSPSEDPMAFLITQESIAPGEVGKGMINGTTQVKIVINNINHNYARPLTGTFNLETAQTGPARIQFKEAGVGEKFAVIQMSTSDSQRIKIINNSGQTIPEGGAMQVSAMNNPAEFTVIRPDKDNVIHVIPNTGPPILNGNTIFLDAFPMLRFKVALANVAKMPPGANIGVVEGRFELDISRFGFLVYGVDLTSPNGPYAYVGLNGIVSLLTAVADEVDGKIDVERSDITGAGDGDTFTLDVVSE